MEKKRNMTFIKWFKIKSTNLKCFLHGHWWMSQNTYDVPEIEQVPGAPIGTYREVIFTYATRKCRRCGVIDGVLKNKRSEYYRSCRTIIER